MHTEMLERLSLPHLYTVMWNWVFLIWLVHVTVLFCVYVKMIIKTNLVIIISGQGAVVCPYLE